MHRKIISSVVIGLSLTAYGQAALAKKSVCDGQVANIVGTNKSDTIVINDDGTNHTYILNGSEPRQFTPPAVVQGGNGKDHIVGSQFDDIICGGNGKDIIEGGDGSKIGDRIFGEKGKDELYGDFKDETVICDPELVVCKDYIAGGNGKDTIYGGKGNDILEGENGRDVIDGGRGSDIINGGHGKDTCSADPNAADDFSECELTP